MPENSGNTTSLTLVGKLQNVFKQASHLKVGLFLLFISIFVIIGAANAHAASDGDGVMFYVKDSNTTPQYRTFDGVTNYTLGSETSTGAAGSQGTIVQIKASPTKPEMVAGYVDTSGNVQIMCFDGTTWTNEWSDAVGGTGTTRRFDIAYETTSGDVLVVYTNNDTATTNELSYRTKSGSTGCGTANWSAESNFDPVRTSGVVYWVKMNRNPVASSNLIALSWLDANADLSAAIWNGSSFTNEPSAVSEANVDFVSASADVDNFDVVYESSSGDLMMLWGRTVTSNTNGAYYRTCTGGTSSCTWNAITAMPSGGDRNQWMEISANPVTDQIAVTWTGEAGTSDDLRGAYWTGSAWTAYALDTSTEDMAAGRQPVSTTWAINGAATRWIANYDDATGTGISWYLATPGSTPAKQTDWTSSPSVNDIRYRLQAWTNPLDNSRGILLLSDANGAVYAKDFSMDSSGVVTWHNADGGASLSTIPSAPRQNFSFAYWIVANTGIDIGGTCKKADRSTDCDGNDGSDSIKVAVDGVVQAQTDSTIDGAWNISGVTVPSGSVVTVFIDGETEDSKEAVAVTKYDGSGDITGMLLYWDHLTIGSDDNPTITNTDLSAYDNSVSSDEDVFFDVSGTSLTLDATAQSSTETLYIKSGTTYTPGGNITTGGSFLNAGTYTTGTETLTFNATSTGHTATFNGGTFYNITFDGSGGGWTLQDNVTVSGSLNVTTGTFNAGSNTITLSGAGGGGDSWCNDSTGITCDSGWLYRKKITFDNTASAGALTDFPVLVQLTSSNIDFAKVEVNGADLRFVDPADNTTVLDHEIENWDEAGTSYVWVRVPSLAATNSDYVWMYYGKSGASDGQNATGVWDSNFKGVWHLDEAVTDEGATVDAYTDSTTNTNDGDQSGPDDAAGKIGSGQLFVGDSFGATDHINANSAAGIDNFTQKTVSMWVKRNVSTAISNTLVSKQTATPAGWMTEIRRSGASSGGDRVRFGEAWGGSAGGQAIWYGSTDITTDTAWYHIAVTYDNSSTSNVPIIYVNGTAESITQVQGPAGALQTDETGDLAFGEDIVFGGAPHDGMLDEIRYSSNLRTADWIEAEYLFSVDNSKYTYGTEESSSSGTPLNISGTLNTDTSTIDFTAGSATSIPARAYYNLGLKPGTNDTTFTLSSGTYTVGGALTLGNGTNTGVAIDANTNDPVLDVASNFTIANNTTFQASASASLSVGGNWSVGATNGAFTHNSSTVTFDGTGTSKTINPASSNFYNLIFDGSGSEWSPLTNTITVANDLTVTAGTVNNDDGSSNIVVNGNVACGVTCGSLALTAGTFTQNITDNKNFGTSVAGSTAWSFNNLTFTGTTDTITTSTTGSGNITVAGALTISANTTLDAGNRTWILSGTGTPLSISGTFTPNTSTFQYTHGTSATVTATTFNGLTLGGTGTYTLPASGWSMTGNLAITSGATVTKGAGSLTWSPSGTKTWTDGNATSQDIGTVSITGGSSTPTIQLASSVRASKITIDASHVLHGGGSYTLTLTGTDGTPLVVTGTFTPSTSTVAFIGDNSGGNTTIPAITYNNLTVNNGTETFDLAGTTTVGGDLTISTGTLDTVSGQNYALNIGGSFSNSGTFVARNGTVTFTGTSGNPNGGSNGFGCGNAMYNLVFNNASGAWSTSTGFCINNNLTITAGTLTTTHNIYMNGSGNLSGAGTLSSSGAVTLAGSSGGFTNDGNWSMASLTVGDGGSGSHTFSGSGGLTISNTFTTTASHTIDLGSKTIILTKTGSGHFPGANNAGISPSTSTIRYTGNGSTTVSDIPYYNLEIQPSDAVTHTLPASLTVGGNLTLGDGNSGRAVTASTNTTNISLSGNLVINNNTTYTKGSGTLTLSPSGAKTITDNNTTKQDLGIISITGGSSTPKISLASSVKVESVSIASSHELDLTGAYTLTLTGNGASVFSNSGTFTAGSASTVDFSSAATTGTTIPALTYYNLTVNKASNTFTAASGTLTIGNNLNVTAGTLDLTTNNPTTSVTGTTTIGGTLEAPSSLTISGDFTNNGTFNANSGDVIVTPSGYSINILGNSTDFASFTVSSQSGKSVVFKALNTYGFSGLLTLTGDSTNSMRLVSDTPGTQWTINLTGTHNLNYVYVQDVECSGNDFSGLGEQVVNGGNNGSCWKFKGRGNGGGNATDGGSPGGGAGQGGGGQSGGGQDTGGNGAGGGAGQGGGGAGGGGGAAAP